MNLFHKMRMVLSFDEVVRIRGLNLMAGWLLKNYRLGWHQIDWFNDEEFTAALEPFGEGRSLNTHRKWTLWQLLRLIEGVKGDTAECGVFEGASSWLICVANNASPLERMHHLFDSFEGLSEPDAKDGDYWNRGDLAVGKKIVARNLHPFSDHLSFHEGWIPDRFPDVADKNFAFVHVDVDLYQPTLDSVAFFYERLSPGGIFLCDDYGFSSCPGATKAIDEFLADKQEKMVSLASGGGFFIKGISTALPISPLATAHRLVS